MPRKDLKGMLDEIGEIGSVAELDQRLSRYQIFANSCRKEAAKYNKFVEEYEMLIGACEARYETLTKEEKTDDRD